MVSKEWRMRVVGPAVPLLSDGGAPCVCDGPAVGGTCNMRILRSAGPWAEAPLACV